MENKNLMLKIISYNIHSGKNLFMIPKLNNMIDFLKDERVDIIGLQEINENDRRGNQFSKIKNNLEINGIFAPNAKVGNGYYGVGTFTPFEIIKTKNILLPSKKEQRGLLHTVIKIGNIKLNVLNTHLGLDTTKRIEQFEVIENYLNSLHSPFILMGDFNTTTPKFNPFTITDTAKATKKEYLSTFLCPNKRIDYIFISNTLKIIDYQVFPIKLSDHYPVIVRIMI